MTIAIARMDSVFMVIVGGSLCRQRCEAKTQLPLRVTRVRLEAGLPFAKKLPSRRRLRTLFGYCVHIVTAEATRRLQFRNALNEWFSISADRTVSGEKPRAWQTLRNAKGEEYSLAVSQR